jgi:hypothetical protein
MINLMTGASESLLKIVSVEYFTPAEVGLKLTVTL